MTIRQKKGRTKAAVKTRKPSGPWDETNSEVAEKPAKPKKEKKPKKKKIDKAKLEAEKVNDLLAAQIAFASSIHEWEVAHANAAELKKSMERKHALMNRIVGDIAAIRSGNYTMPLPFGEEPPTVANRDTPSTLRADGPWKDVQLSTLVY